MTVPPAFLLPESGEVERSPVIEWDASKGSFRRGFSLTVILHEALALDFLLARYAGRGLFDFVLNSLSRSPV